MNDATRGVIEEAHALEISRLARLNAEKDGALIRMGEIERKIAESQAKIRDLEQSIREASG